jgi:hypothetical protein
MIAHYNNLDEIEPQGKISNLQLQKAFNHKLTL